MFTGFHWYDLVIPLIMLVLLIVALVAVGWGIGAGYAWMRRRQNRQPGQP